MGESLDVLISGYIEEVDFFEDVADAKEPVGVGGLIIFFVEVLFKAEKLLIVHIIPFHLLHQILILFLKHLLLDPNHRVPEPYNLQLLLLHLFLLITIPLSLNLYLPWPQRVFLIVVLDQFQQIHIFQLR